MGTDREIIIICHNLQGHCQVRPFCSTSCEFTLLRQMRYNPIFTFDNFIIFYISKFIAEWFLFKRHLLHCLSSILNIILHKNCADWNVLSRYHEKKKRVDMFRGGIIFWEREKGCTNGKRECTTPAIFKILFPLECVFWKRCGVFAYRILAKWWYILHGGSPEPPAKQDICRLGWKGNNTIQS